MSNSGLSLDILLAIHDMSRMARGIPSSHPSRHDILRFVRVKPLDILNDTLKHFPAVFVKMENVSKFHLKYPVVSLLQMLKCHVEQRSLA